jgi:hypothetical protein
MPDQKQGQLASLIISIIILVIVIILIVIVCCGYNNNQSSSPLIQNPQAAAALYAYAHAHGNKNNFYSQYYTPETAQCEGKAINEICTIDQQVGECEMQASWLASSYLCCKNNKNECFTKEI